MKGLTTFVIAVAFLSVTGNAQATIIADVRADFVLGVSNGDLGIVPATGTGTWSYLASDTVNPILDGTLDVLVWNVPNQSYHYVFRNAVDLQSGALTSDEIRMHPSYLHPMFVVVRWTSGAGEAGVIDISGNARKVATADGFGVTFDIFVDGVSVFNSTLAYNDTVGVAFNEIVTVGVGSTVDFIVGPNGDDGFDSTGLRVTISPVVPEPATALLFASGLAALAVGRRRRRM